MKEDQLNLFGFIPKNHIKPVRDYNVEYERRKQLKRNREELVSRLMVLDFDCPFDSASDWVGTGSSINKSKGFDKNNLNKISEEQIIYLHREFMFRTLSYLDDNRVNKMLKQQIYESWVFAPILNNSSVQPFSFEACCALYWDEIDPYEVQCLFIDSKHHDIPFAYSFNLSDSDLPAEVRAAINNPFSEYSYPWKADESAKSHLDILKLHERAIQNRSTLPSELFVQVIEWINRTGWTDDYRLMPFSFDACCKYAGVDASEHRKYLINKIRM